MPCFWEQFPDPNAAAEGSAGPPGRVWELRRGAAGQEAPAARCHPCRERGQEQLRVRALLLGEAGAWQKL